MSIRKSDKYYLDFIRNTKFLQENTKKIYEGRIRIMQKEMWDNCDKQTIHHIVHNPKDFLANFIKYTNNRSGRLTDSLSDHTKDSYVSSIIALFIYNQDLKESYSDLYKEWKALHENIKKPINTQYKSNTPNEKQQSAYISFDELIRKRDSLSNSPERLLLFMYSEIPPVRSDYYKTQIFYSVPKDIDNGNYIVLPSLHASTSEDSAFLVLQSYKTASKYGVITVNLPDTLRDEIINSIKLIPRDYLFISNRTGKPYKEAGSYNKWANRVLKNLFAKPGLSLTMLRHIFISRPDLKLEEKSGLEQEEIAKIMGHSIERQRNYSWHTWLKKKEFDN